MTGSLLSPPLTGPVLVGKISLTESPASHQPLRGNLISEMKERSSTDNWIGNSISCGKTFSEILIYREIIESIKIKETFHNIWFNVFLIVQVKCDAKLYNSLYSCGKFWEARFLANFKGLSCLAAVNIVIRSSWLNLLVVGGDYKINLRF